MDVDRHRNEDGLAVPVFGEGVVDDGGARRRGGTVHDNDGGRRAGASDLGGAFRFHPRLQAFLAVLLLAEGFPDRVCLLFEGGDGLGGGIGGFLLLRHLMAEGFDFPFPAFESGLHPGGGGGLVGLGGGEGFQL